MEARARRPRDQPAPAPWLSLLPAPQLYPAGTVLVQQGCEPYEIFFVEYGLAKLVRIDAGGREQILDCGAAGWFLERGLRPGPGGRTPRARSR